MQMAGPAAEIRFLGRRAIRGARTDTLQAKLLLASVNTDERAFNAHYRRVRQQARVLIQSSEHWAAIRAIAAAVLEQQHLDLAEASVVMGRALG